MMIGNLPSTKICCDRGIFFLGLHPNPSEIRETNCHSERVAANPDLKNAKRSTPTECHLIA